MLYFLSLLMGCTGAGLDEPSGVDSASVSPDLLDVDGDGLLPPADCDPFDPEVYAGREETAYDGKDNDCDPQTPDDDLDGDGFLLSDDCDDLDPSVAPDAVEIRWDGVDNDCDPSTLDRPIGDRLYTSCQAAKEGLALADGLHEGTTDAWDSAYANDQCAVGSAGREAYVALDVAAGAVLDLSWTVEGDGVLFLLDDCQADDRCLLGQDLTFEGTERVRWVNTGSSERRLYAVFDATQRRESARAWAVKLQTDFASPAQAADRCSSNQPPLTDGLYWQTFSGFTDERSLSCSGVPTGGAEAFALVRVPAESLLTVSAFGNGQHQPPSLQLLSSCSSETCLTEHQNLFTSAAALAWYNPDPVDVDLQLVVDSIQPGTLETVGLDLSTEWFAPLRAASTCEAVQQLASIGPGRYAGTLMGAGADFSSPCLNGQTGGEEVFVRVELLAGQQLDVLLDDLGQNGTLLLLDDCGAPEACYVASAGVGPEVIHYANATGAAQTLTLVLDSRAFNPARSFLLDVSIR